jgi:hypothetical protein
MRPARLASFVFVSATILTTAPLAQQQVYDPGNGVSLPVVVKEVKPHYTQAAMNAGIEGTVELESVVWRMGPLGMFEWFALLIQPTGSMKKRLRR